MAYAQTLSPSTTFRDVHAIQTQQLPTLALGHSITHGSPMQQHSRPGSKQRFVTELSQCLFDFVIQLLPTQEEMAVKEDVRKLLERLIRTIEPDSRLLSFGSTANGFSLRNSDMDLCCLIDSEEKLSATDLVTMLGDLLERETKFHVKPLPHARIPIVKLSLDPSPGLPLGIACDIGFENRLALENTRLLMCYAMIDPTRVRTLVLFLKVWSKRRKINSPYKGTLSSYGYVLLVIYFLVHVKNPPVLPNLQQMPPLRPITKEDTHLNGYNTWFFDDIDLLRQRWHSENTESVAELLIEFFRYYARDFTYNTGVASIRAGLLKKDSKGWQNELSNGRFTDARERNRLCIEDPFELDYNVARCVTRDGLYTIRGEFMRAARVLASRPERAVIALAELCEERKDEELVIAPPYTSSRPPTLPPQTPYTIGSQPMRPKGTSLSERFSPPAQFFEPGPRHAPQPAQQVTPRPPPDHMAPKRAKWTSPPPPEATPADVALFESQLGKSLVLATSSTAARELESAYNSESNSEVFTDEDRSDAAESDDIASVRSYTERSSIAIAGPFRRPSWHTSNVGRLSQTHVTYNVVPSETSSSRSSSSSRGRFPRPTEKLNHPPPTSCLASPELSSSSPRLDPSRRSLSGPPRSIKSGSPVWTSHTPLAISTPLPPSPESPMESRFNDPSTVFYQTAATRSPRPTVIYPTPGPHNSFLSHYQSQPHSPHSPGSPFQQAHSQQLMSHIPQDIFPPNLPPALSSLNPRNIPGRPSGPETPTPTTYSCSHSHSHSTIVTAPTPPPYAVQCVAQPTFNRSPLIPSSNHQSPLPSQAPQLPLASQLSDGFGADRELLFAHDANESASPQASAVNSNGSSPTPSSTGYSTSISRSPSPHSPSPPPTAMPIKHKDGGDLSFNPSFSTSTVCDNGDLPSLASPTFFVDVGQHGDNAQR